MSTNIVMLSEYKWTFWSDLGDSSSWKSIFHFLYWFASKYLTRLGWNQCRRSPFPVSLYVMSSVMSHCTELAHLFLQKPFIMLRKETQQYSINDNSGQEQKFFAFMCLLFKIEILLWVILIMYCKNLESASVRIAHLWCCQHSVNAMLKSLRSVVLKLNHF